MLILETNRIIIFNLRKQWISSSALWITASVSKGVTEDMGVGSKRICSAAEGNEWAPGLVVLLYFCFHHVTSLITLRRKTKGILTHLMPSPEVKRARSF